MGLVLRMAGKWRFNQPKYRRAEIATKSLPILQMSKCRFLCKFWFPALRWLCLPFDEHYMHLWKKAGRMDDDSSQCRHKWRMPWCVIFSQNRKLRMLIFDSPSNTWLPWQIWRSDNTGGNSNRYVPSLKQVHLWALTQLNASLNLSKTRDLKISHTCTYSCILYKMHVHLPYIYLYGQSNTSTNKDRGQDTRPNLIFLKSQGWK